VSLMSSTPKTQLSPTMKPEEGSLSVSTRIMHEIPELLLLCVIWNWWLTKANSAAISLVEFHVPAIAYKVRLLECDLNLTFMFAMSSVCLIVYQELEWCFDDDVGFQIRSFWQHEDKERRSLFRRHSSGPSGCTCKQVKIKIKKWKTAHQMFAYMHCVFSNSETKRPDLKMFYWRRCKI
jgi:hypothetical protein